MITEKNKVLLRKNQPYLLHNHAAPFQCISGFEDMFY